MGLDGFSMSNLGMYNRLTSAQMANEAEFLAMQGNGSDIKDIEALSNKSGIARKENDYLFQEAIFHECSDYQCRQLQP